MRKIIIVMLVLFVSACSTKPIDIKPLVYHPPRPVPIKTYVPDWKVIKDGDNTYVGMTYEQSILYRTWLEKLGGYIESQNNMLCVYRKDLKEDVCIKAAQ